MPSLTRLSLAELQRRLELAPADAANLSRFIESLLHTEQALGVLKTIGMQRQAAAGGTAAATVTALLPTPGTTAPFHSAVNATVATASPTSSVASAASSAVNAPVTAGTTSLPTSNATVTSAHPTAATAAAAGTATLTATNTTQTPANAAPAVATAQSHAQSESLGALVQPYHLPYWDVLFCAVAGVPQLLTLPLASLPAYLHEADGPQRLTGAVIKRQWAVRTLGERAALQRLCALGSPDVARRIPTLVAASNTPTGPRLCDVLRLSPAVLAQLSLAPALRYVLNFLPEYLFHLQTSRSHVIRVRDHPKLLVEACRGQRVADVYTLLVATPTLLATMPLYQTCIRLCRSQELVLLLQGHAAAGLATAAGSMAIPPSLTPPSAVPSAATVTATATPPSVLRAAGSEASLPALSLSRGRTTSFHAPRNPGLLAPLAPVDLYATAAVAVDSAGLMGAGMYDSLSAPLPRLAPLVPPATLATRDTTSTALPLSSAAPVRDIPIAAASTVTGTGTATEAVPPDADGGTSSSSSVRRFAPGVKRCAALLGLCTILLWVFSIVQVLNLDATKTLYAGDLGSMYVCVPLGLGVLLLMFYVGTALRYWSTLRWRHSLCHFMSDGMLMLLLLLCLVNGFYLGHQAAADLYEDGMVVGVAHLALFQARTVFLLMLGGLNYVALRSGVRRARRRATGTDKPAGADSPLLGPVRDGRGNTRRQQYDYQTLPQSAAAVADLHRSTLSLSTSSLSDDATGSADDVSTSAGEHHQHHSRRRPSGRRRGTLGGRSATDSGSATRVPMWAGSMLNTWLLFFTIGSQMDFSYFSLLQTVPPHRLLYVGSFYVIDLFLLVVFLRGTLLWDDWGCCGGSPDDRASAVAEAADLLAAEAAAIDAEGDEDDNDETDDDDVDDGGDGDTEREVLVSNHSGPLASLPSTTAPPAAATPATPATAPPPPLLPPLAPASYAAVLAGAPPTPVPEHAQLAVLQRQASARGSASDALASSKE